MIIAHDWPFMIAYSFTSLLLIPVECIKLLHSVLTERWAHLTTYGKSCSSLAVLNISVHLTICLLICFLF